MRTKFISILTSATLLAACATDVATRVLPREDGTIAAISVAREEAAAADANVKKANRYCEKQEGTAVFLEEETEYQGVLTTRGEAAARIIKRVPVLAENLTSDEDYRVTTCFKCLPAQ
jgi:hypothetical protein